MKSAMLTFTPAENSYCEKIHAKDRTLRGFLEENSLSDPIDARQWLIFLTGIKHALGNLNNDVGFVATLLVKDYLVRRFGILGFDAAAKPQAASGIDVEAMTPDGKTIVGELKTTRPYQPGFGAQQRTTILKDLARLSSVTADHRFMFVIDPDAFQMLCRKTFASRAPGVEVVDLLAEKSFLCPRS